MLVGWDWASTAHDGTVIDDAGAVVDRWTPPHTEAGLSDALVRLGRSGRPEELPVAIEQSSGLFVDRLWRRPPGRSRPCQRLPRRPSVIATGWPPPWPEPCCPTPNRPSPTTTTPATSTAETVPGIRQHLTRTASPRRPEPSPATTA
jgi:hypothetical protein